MPEGFNGLEAVALGRASSSAGRGGPAGDCPGMAEYEDMPTAWLKSLHYHDDDYTIMPGEETWISDVGRRTPTGARVYRRDGEAWDEPSWKVDDEIALYYGGTLCVPVLVVVVAPPEFNPQLVQRDSHGQEPDAGERGTFNDWERSAISRLADELASVIERATGSIANAVFADSRDAFAGHLACGPAEWINGPYLSSPGESFHPNRAGYEALVDVVARAGVTRPPTGRAASGPSRGLASSGAEMRRFG
jgi:hypothetical protein